MSRPDSTDVCVIGAGPAGAILAASLAARGRDVVILEAGPRFDLENRVAQMETGLRAAHPNEAVWDMGGPRDAFTWAGESDYDLNTHRVKGVGGTTLHWGGMTPRLHPEDFEMDTRHGLAEDWPIGYDDLRPYYARAEHELGVSGAPNRFSGPRREPYPLSPFPPSYSDELLQGGFDAEGIEVHTVPRAMNSEPYDGRSECVGYGTCQIVCPSGGKYDASVHVRKAEAGGARVRANAPVERLEFDGAGDRVAAAVYTDADGIERRQAAEAFVVACGAVESARLLHRSAGGRSNALGAISDTVGRNLMLHPALKVVGRMGEPTRQHLIGFATSMTEQFYDYHSGPEGSMLIQLSNTAGPHPATAATAQTSHARSLVEQDLGALVGGELGTEFPESYTDVDDLVALTAWVEQFPDPDNRVALDASKTDDRGNPVPELHWRLDDRSRSALGAAERVCVDILEAAGATDVRTVGGPSDPLLLSHRAGTTRMGTDPADSVVDPDLGVHGLSNLYVSSSGVFVTEGAANPTLTIAALALRLADHVHDRLGGEVSNDY